MNPTACPEVRPYPQTHFFDTFSVDGITPKAGLLRQHAQRELAPLLHQMLVLPADIAAGPTPESWVSIVILGVVCSALAFVLYFALIREVGPRRSTLITYLNLLVAALLGVLFLAEPITPGILVGLPLIVVGSYLAGRDRAPYVRKKDRVKS